jgi:hypothetical protein
MGSRLQGSVPDFGLGNQTMHRSQTQGLKPNKHGCWEFTGSRTRTKLPSSHSQTKPCLTEFGVTPEHLTPAAPATMSQCSTQRLSVLGSNVQQFQLRTHNQELKFLNSIPIINNIKESSCFYTKILPNIIRKHPFLNLSE